MTTCKLSELISPAFYHVHQAIKREEITELVAKGGRGSTKSSYISIEVLLLLLKHPNTHAAVFRKVGNTLRTSVYAQYCWAVSALGLMDKFKCTISPMEITYKKTGQKIMFFGLDDPGKVKSIKVPFGYIAIAHFEEMDQFSGDEEIRNVEQSIFRGGPLAFCFKSFNPPPTASNWANRYVMQVSKPRQLIHHSTFHTTPEEWLGSKFLTDAEYLRQTNLMAYSHEYEGEVTGTGTSVFTNLKIEPIPDEQLNRYDRIMHGVDWGYYPDPWAYNANYFDAARRVLYIFDELTRYRTGNRATADALFARGLTVEDDLTADSAEPKSVADYRSYGLACRGAEKGPGSVEYSHKWLQSLTAIIIDPVRCPDTAKEFTEYEYEKAKDGSVMTGYPDKNNHHIDAVRYSTERIWRRRGK